MTSSVYCYWESSTLLNRFSNLANSKKNRLSKNVRKFIFVEVERDQIFICPEYFSRPHLYYGDLALLKLPTSVILHKSVGCLSPSPFNVLEPVAARGPISIAAFTGESSRDLEHPQLMSSPLPYSKCSFLATYDSTSITHQNTYLGFSGGPHYVDGKIVGIHSHASGNLSDKVYGQAITQSRFDWIQSMQEKYNDSSENIWISILRGRSENIKTFPKILIFNLISKHPKLLLSIYQKGNIDLIRLIQSVSSKTFIHAFETAANLPHMVENIYPRHLAVQTWEFFPDIATMRQKSESALNFINNGNQMLANKLIAEIYDNGIHKPFLDGSFVIAAVRHNYVTVLAKLIYDVEVDVNIGSLHNK